MLTVETAAGCVTVRRRVDRWKISAYFASTDTISDKKDNHSGRTDHGQQLRPQDADDTCQPSQPASQPAKAFALELTLTFFFFEHDHDLSDIRYRFRYGFRCSDASSDAGIEREAGGGGAAARPLRRPFPDGGAQEETCAKGGRGSKRRPRWGRRIECPWPAGAARNPPRPWNSSPGMPWARRYPGYPGGSPNGTELARRRSAPS